MSESFDVERYRDLVQNEYMQKSVSLKRQQRLVEHLKFLCTVQLVYILGLAVVVLYG